MIKYRQAFTKCSTVKKAICVIRQVKQSFELQAFEKLKINDKYVLSEDVVEIKQNDKIQFLCDSNCSIPHLFHLIISELNKNKQEKFPYPKEKVYQPILGKKKDLKINEIRDPKNWIQHHPWTKEEKRSLKRIILMFGYDRWSKMRSISKHSDKLIFKKDHNEIRAYANYFISLIVDCLSHDNDNKELIKKLLSMVQVKEQDVKVDASASDFGDSFSQMAKNWGKRLVLINNIVDLVRRYKNQQAKFQSLPHFNQDQRLQKLYKTNINLLNFLSQEQLSPARPALVWTRRHDVDLIMGSFDYGYANYEAILKSKTLIFEDTSQGKFKSNMMTKRIKYVMKQVLLFLKSNHNKYDFERTDHVKEASGFSLLEKNTLYEILINYGVPVISNDDPKDDYELLKVLLVKHVKGIDADVNLGPDSVKPLEKFIQQLNIMSTKIMKDYQKPVAEILAQWKEEDQSGEESSEKEEQKGENGEVIPKKEEEVNDFKIDKQRIKAAHEYEKTCQRLVYDPDGDGFNFGYERALYFKVRTNMFKLIRKEIMAQNFRLYEQCLENLAQILRDEKEKQLTKLPDEWICDKHDRHLLKAVSDQGLPFLNKMKENTDYGFENINVPRKRLQKRLEYLCLFFKEQLLKLRKNNPSLRGADLSTGQTQIDPRKKFTKIEVERDEYGNIKYPIIVSPTLQILNLGIIEFEKPFYHSEKNFFPIGFKSLRDYTSMVRPGERCQYICEILDGGPKPLFKVTCSEDPQNPLIRDSSSGVWIDICKKINEIQGNKRTNVTVSGPDRYGLAEPGVNQLLQCLANADKCVKYKFIY
ncbi:f y-rich n-terminus family protein [Stylonychia lemnae]|uniref:F y-rich n-terminus family protein n=1 Tax=Stylonychia lemnae TaxID=5949 RepID=A0A078ARQ2_STYLE|nr:f y-rich n-terminus family protein [Stylonychia lemnae]|eukprot:CDW85165.1 f y-rich n-terminus family protein [Stylonychia lemnae]